MPAEAALTVSDTDVAWVTVVPKLAVIVIGPYVPTRAFAIFKVDCTLPFAGTETDVGETVHVAFVGQPEVTLRVTLPENPLTEDMATV